MGKTNSWVVWAILGIVVIAAAVLNFSQLIGVDAGTGGRVLVRLVALMLVAFAVMAILRCSLFAILPLLLTGLVWAACPALDFYAAMATGEAQWGFRLKALPWYGLWYGQAALLALPLVAGYGWRGVAGR